MNNMVGTIEGKMSTMTQAQREFHNAVGELHAAQNRVQHANTDFTLSALQEVDALDAKVNTLMADQRQSTSISVMVDRFTNDSKFNKIASIGYNGHIIYTNYNKNIK